MECKVAERMCVHAYRVACMDAIICCAFASL